MEIPEEIREYFSKGIPVRISSRNKVYTDDTIPQLVDSANLELELANLPDYMKNWDVEAKRSYISSLICRTISSMFRGKLMVTKRSETVDFEDDYDILIVLGSKVYPCKFSEVKGEDEIIIPYMDIDDYYSKNFRFIDINTLLYANSSIPYYDPEKLTQVKV